MGDGEPRPSEIPVPYGPCFTADALLESQSEKVEETLWVSLRMLEERRNLLKRMDKKEVRPGGTKNSYAERVKETEVHIERIREMLRARRSSPARTYNI